MRVAFVVQGEGRGHMTQALALASFLRDAGHEVARVLVGRSPHRPIPSYFTDGMDAPVRPFEAPVQVPRRDGQAVSVGRTVADVLRRSPTFVRSLSTIAEATADADVVINFLDLLGGLSRTVFPTQVPALAVAHNYVFLHPGLHTLPGPSGTRGAVLAYARATTAGTQQTLALSFTDLPPHPNPRLHAVPPLLRPGLDALAVTQGDYLLAYALNPGYADTLLRWQRESGGVELHCYVEGGPSALTATPSPGFHAHPLDERAFLDHLSGCRAYVGSAGFESICEAHYLGKPVLAVPTEGQFEQVLNAWDAERCGAARWGSYDDLDDFWSTPDAPDPEATKGFRGWVSRAPQLFVAQIEQTAARATAGAESDDRRRDALT